jgi:L-amino acid N-acyltransferase YncA
MRFGKRLSEHPAPVSGHAESFLVRPARPADATAIGAVHVRAWQAAYRGVMPDEYLDSLSADERAEMWRDRIARDDLAPLLVAETEGVVVGFAAFGRERPSPEQRDAGELGAINIDPDHWGKGIGRSLLRQVTVALWTLGYREAILWVVPQNVRARSLYESEGWRADGAVGSDEVLGVTVTEMRYRTELHD